MSTTTTPGESPNIINELRGLLPLRALTYYEHLQLAERQATALHRLLDQRGPAADLAWLTELPGIKVVLQPRWQMEGLSGLTTWHKGQWIIGVNKGNSHTRRRFTLAHEFKHLLDASRDRVTYKAVTDDQRELIANYFAACYLMPKAWVRGAWTRGLQEPDALAGLFKVSSEAMTNRLTYLGFIDSETDRSLASYFRTELAA
jgi:Zn-dependent peptidase ImmA (M78 family)